MPRNKLIPYRADLKFKARKLRRESTYCEIQLWLEIKNRKLLGYQFHRQVPMLNFIVDFYCHELLLAIELDGASHDTPEAKEYDSYRQQKLEEYGVTFLRFRDDRIKGDIVQVLEEIKRWIVTRALHPPQGGQKSV
jgi:very-short-patch-repair endonuclease